MIATPHRLALRVHNLLAAAAILSSVAAASDKHWAFVSPARNQPPPAEDPHWARNAIDRFVWDRLDQHELRPAPAADRPTLIRRLYYDIVGLPPSPDQLQRFLSDTNAHAYEDLVDELLESPHYGERWARHWLDLVRYAETNSFERDAPKPFVWKYRDYVIRSLNDDKPYDQFIIEQLAGDELDDVTVDSVTATGYYRLGTWDDEPADPLRAKYDDLDNIVSTTGQAFLGLTVGCARCHDHKSDPIQQADYYRLLAFFADITPYALPNRRNAKFHSLWDFSDPLEQTRRKELTEERQTLRTAKRQIESEAIKKMDAADQRRTETSRRQQVLDKKLPLYLSEEELRRYRDLVAQWKQSGSQLQQIGPPVLVLSVAKCEPRPEPMHVMLHGNPHTPGDRVDPGFPAIFGDETPRIAEPEENARSAGRRRIVAEWIASPKNMLTARVIVNRVWQHHFGRGIVRSANNFGRLGTPPTHPELLDWLARWFVDQGWRLKPLHRLILTSSTYRMSSHGNNRALAVDPDNDLFWRFNMRRLSAEDIRDSVLSVSGRLNEQMYGPCIYPKLSQEVLQTQSRPGQNWHTSEPLQASRRSIYIHIKRSLIPPELASFDFPDTDTSCEARFNTTQAAQALNLLHSEFLQTHARHMAERVAGDVGDDTERQVGHALRLALQREPDEATVSDGLMLIDRYVNQHRLVPNEAFRQFCLMVLNLNEFVYLD